MLSIFPSTASTEKRSSHEAAVKPKRLQDTGMVEHFCFLWEENIISSEIMPLNFSRCLDTFGCCTLYLYLIEKIRLYLFFTIHCCIRLCRSTASNASLSLSVGSLNRKVMGPVQCELLKKLAISTLLFHCSRYGLRMESRISV